jgi:hypothetical protein
MSSVEQHAPIFTQAVIQLVFWRYVFDYTQWYTATYCTNQRWFINWSSKPHPLGGDTGDAGLIGQIYIFVQHFVGGACAALGYYLNSPQLFIMGVLSEFSFEVLDLFTMMKQRFITRKGIYSAEMCDPGEFGLFTIHHSGAFTVILPVCMFYADNEYVQQIAWGLLGFSCISLIIFAHSSSRDVYDLKERGQFTVSYFLMFVSMLYFRWYITLTGMYGFISTEFAALSLQWKCLFVFYAVLIKGFDCMFTMFCASQLYCWLFTSKAMVRPTKITKASLKRPSLVPVTMMRMQSTPW